MLLVVPFLQPYIQARRGLQVAMLILLLASFSRAYVSDGDQLLITALFFVVFTCRLYPSGFPWHHESVVWTEKLPL